MGRNKLTPEQTIDNFKKIFAERYPQNQHSPFVLMYESDFELYELLEARSKLSKETAHEFLRKLDHYRNQISCGYHLYDKETYDKRVELFESDKPYECFYKVKLNLDAQDKLDKPEEKPKPFSIAPVDSFFNNAMAIGDTSHLRPAGIAATVVPGINLTPHVGVNSYGNLAREEFVPLAGIDHHMTRILRYCADVKRVYDEPVKTAGDAHRLTSCLNDNLKCLAAELKTAAEQIDQRAK